MPRRDSEAEICLLMRQLEASLASNTSLAKENEELRQEVTRLKAQISIIKAHNNERKSALWKKLSIDGAGNHPDVSPPKPAFSLGVSGQPQLIKQQPQKKELSGLEAEKERPNAVPNAPPPPPPVPSKALVGVKAVKRVPEVTELYRLLTRQDSQKASRAGPTASTPSPALAKNMIGEIENRSTFISAVKSEVATHAEFINYLIREVESAAHKKISDVEAFVRWLDGQLSSLVDERAVLKHFPHWPERKADTLREAACSYRDLTSLASEALSLQDNPREPLAQAARRMQELQDRLERSVSNVERTRESTSKRYRDLKIPWDWMSETGLVGEMKRSSLRLAKEYMKRITRELQSSEGRREENLLLIQGVRFAYRVHQFAGGFNAEAITAFEELRRAGLAAATTSIRQ